MSTRHTSSKIRGQVYISGLNWLMMLMTIAIVLTFQSSEHLAAAYGLAVAVTMTITTILFAVFARQCWHWSLLKISCIAGFFLIIDFAFLAANTLKFFAGGWLPFAIGGLVFLVAVCWFNGRRVLLRSRRELSISTDDFMQSLEAQALPRVQGTAVFLTEHYYRVPNALQHHLRHNQVLHDNMVILVLHKVNTAKLPSQHQRLSIETLDCGFVRIVLRVGYMEDPNVPSALQQAEQQLGQDFFSLDHTSFYLGREALVVAKTSLWRKLWLSVFLWLHKNEHDASSYFKLPSNRVIEMGTRIALR